MSDNQNRMNNKILVSPTTFGQVSNEPIELLKAHGFEIVRNPFSRTMHENEVKDYAKDCVGIVAGLEPWNKQVIDACINLKCISRVGVGMDNVDQEYAKKKGVTVVNTPFGPTLAVAEMTLGLTLSLLRKIPESHARMKNGIWKKEIGNLLSGKTIGIIGLGRIGQTTAGMFTALGNKVLAFDPFANKEWAKKNNVIIMEFDELLSKADIVTIHVPAGEDKKPIFTKQKLELMKPGSFMINVSRGSVVDESALLDLLKSGHLNGAAIDVFDEEPYSGPFVSLTNVVLTPHMGSYAAEAKVQMEIDAVNNLIAILK